jgi:Tetratricopeptide repeat
MPLTFRTTLATAAFVCSTAIGGIANADAVAEGQMLAQKAIDAEKAGDAAAAADFFGQALRQRPNHPGLTIRLARASLAAGRNDDAVASLEDYAAMGLNADIDNEAWKPLSADPRWQLLRARFAENAKPVGDISIAATLDELELIAEGIAFDPSNERIYIGSVRKRKILSVDQSGAVSTLVAQADAGLLGVFGITFHKPSATLWAASSALPQVAGLGANDKGRADVYAFDVNGRLKKRVMLPADGKEHVLGDLAVTVPGAIYTTDSFGPNVYRLRAGGDVLESLIMSDTFHSLQGLALSPAETKLAVADYSSGIHVIDLEKRSSTLLAMPQHTTLHGVDALVPFGRDLLAVQNGIDPQRVIRIRLDPAWTKIEGVDVLAANLPEMDEPTLATSAGNDLLVVGNGQWSRFNDDGTVNEANPSVPTRIVRLKLPKARP